MRGDQLRLEDILNARSTPSSPTQPRNARRSTPTRWFKSGSFAVSRDYHGLSMQRVYAIAERDFPILKAQISAILDELRGVE